MNEIESEIRAEIFKRLRAGRQISPGCLNPKTNKHADEAIIRRMIKEGALAVEPDGKFVPRDTDSARAI